MLYKLETVFDVPKTLMRALFHQINKDDGVTIFNHQTESLEETDQLGAALAQSLQPGLVIALVGNLGSGKTRFTQAIAVEMGVPQEEVNSPTFVLIQEYQASIPLYHFDVYRLKDDEEFLELGADELMFGEGVCLIEWADRVSNLLPKDCLQIKIEPTGETSRNFQFKSSGFRSDSVLQKLKSILGSR